MTLFLLALVVSGATAGDLLKAAGMRRLTAQPEFGGASQALALAARSGLLWLCLVGYAVSFFGFMALVSIEDVSYAVPATAAGFVLETLLAKWLLGETVSRRRWAGATFIVIGVALVGG